MDSIFPRVSVCIASYNHAQYLTEMLNSVLAQTYRNFEVNVVDDGSTDDSLAILTEFASRHGNVNIFKHPNGENKGISATTNLAIAKSKGELISFIGSDDMWYSDIIERQIAEFDKQPSLGMVYGRVHSVSQDGTTIIGEFGRDITRSAAPYEELIRMNVIPAITVMVRRHVLDEVGLFDTNLIYGDWELSIRILRAYRAEFIDAPLAKYRIHDANTSIGSGADPEKVAKNSRAVMASIRKTFGSSSAIDEGLRVIDDKLAHAYLDEYFEAFYKKDGGRNFNAIKKALSVSPFVVFQFRRLAAILKSLLPHPKVSL